MIEVSVNHLLLQIESNSFKLSCIRFCKTSKSVTISPETRETFARNFRTFAELGHFLFSREMQLRRLVQSRDALTSDNRIGINSERFEPVTKARSPNVISYLKRYWRT